jgi:hypothetical protein
MPAAMSLTKSPEVFDVTSEPGLRLPATISKTFFLIARFYTTTSMIQSTSPSQAMSSS